jgi:hypothetical protein
MNLANRGLGDSGNRTKLGNFVLVLPEWDASASDGGVGRFVLHARCGAT